MSLNGRYWGTNKSDEISLHADWDLEFASFVSISAYRKGDRLSLIDYDGTSATVVHFGSPVISSKQYSQEFQLLSQSSSPIKWVVGLFGMKETGGFQPVEVNAYPVNSFTSARALVRTTSFAAFAEATAPIMDELRLTVGGRYSKDKKKIFGRSLKFYDADSYGPRNLLSEIIFDNAQRSWNAFTPKITLDYKLGDTLLYATFSKGFKSGAYNLTDYVDNTQPVNPEKVDAFEVGTKSEFFDRKLIFNTSFFRYSYKNLQVEVTNGDGTTIQENAAGAKIWGAEADLTARVAHGLNINASASYLHARYTKFDAAATYIPDLVTGVGNIPSSVNAKGNHLQRAPTWSFSGGVDYTHEFGNDSSLKLSLDAYYTDGFYWDSANAIIEPGYGYLNSSITYSLPGGKASIAVWAQNLTKAHWGVYHDMSNLGQDYMDGAPRTFGLTVTYQM